jgi:hypothetical protein
MGEQLGRRNVLCWNGDVVCRRERLSLPGPMRPRGWARHVGGTTSVFLECQAEAS